MARGLLHIQHNEPDGKITMMGIRRIGLTAVLVSLLLASGVANAGSITTTFAGGNGFAGNMFDLTVGPNPLTVTAIDVHTRTRGLSYDISLYFKLGSYVGFEGNSVPWTQVGKVTVVGGGLGVPVFVDLPDFNLAAGALYGIYVDVDNYSVGNSSHILNYTNGNNVFANADLSLNLGTGLGNPAFSGSIFRPRTWNGTIYYDVAVPAPTTLLLLGLGLAGIGFSGRRQVH